MFMGGVEIMAGSRGRPCPSDFPETFIVKGRLACEEHYGVSRPTVTRWLIECDMRRLIAARATFVRNVIRKELRRKRPEDFETAYVQLGFNECCRRYKASRQVVSRWLSECDRERLRELRDAQRLNRRDIGVILSRAYPTNPKRAHQWRDRVARP